jgi:hypothetical protein
MVLSEPVEGREAEYNDWYTDTHLPDLCRIPGIVAAERLRAVDTAMNRNQPRHPYLALYTIDCDDVQAVVAEILRRRGTPEMPSTDAINGPINIVQMFEVFAEAAPEPRATAEPA